MDVKEKIEELAEKILSDKTLQSQFKKDPIKAVEKLLGIDLPDDVIKKIVKGVQAKIGLESAADAVGLLKKLF